MDDYETREVVRRAIRDLVRRGGAEMVIRSGPAGRTEEPEPIAGLRAAAAVGYESRRLIGRYARQAREDGYSWQQVAVALGRDSDPSAIFGLLASDLGAGLVFPWTCPACGQGISDRGPEAGNLHDAEPGHRDGCGRVRAWETRGETDIDGLRGEARPGVACPLA